MLVIQAKYLFVIFFKENNNNIIYVAINFLSFFTTCFNNSLLVIIIYQIQNHTSTKNVYLEECGAVCGNILLLFHSNISIKNENFDAIHALIFCIYLQEVTMNNFVCIHRWMKCLSTNLVFQAGIWRIFNGNGK